MTLNRYKSSYRVLVTPFLVTEGQASPLPHKHLGLTMYWPGFTVTSLHTSLVLHAGNWGLGIVKYSDEKVALVMKENGIKSQKTSLVAPGAEQFLGKVSNSGFTLYQRNGKGKFQK